MTRPREASYLSLVYIVGLLALLVVLAVLQYRWTGEASLAEQERMRQGLNESLGLFERSFDAEISQLVLAYWGLPSSELAETSNWQAALAPQLADASHRWQASATDPRLVSRVLVAESQAGSPPRLYSLSAVTGQLERVEWPENLAGLERTFPPNQVLPQEGIVQERYERRHLPSDFTIDQIPALVHVLLAQPARLRQEKPGPGQQRQADTPRLYLIVCLDRDYLYNYRIPDLAKRYLLRESEIGYDYALTSRETPRLILSSSPGVDPGGIVASPDGRVDLLVLKEGLFEGHLLTGQERRRRPEPERGRVGAEPHGVPGGGGGPRLETAEIDRAAQESFIEQRRHLETAVEMLASRGWQLLAKHRSGSLNAAVATTRRRNLAVSLGILLLLGTSLVVLTISVRRAQRLSKQQMEFVAGVSHELRTPIAVICSTAENLADGVITPNEQVRRYGQYILREGWRLDTLVEQTMEFAGIGSGIRRFHMEPVDLGGIVNEAVGAFRAQIAEKQLNVELCAPPGAMVNGDSAALGCAVGNLISNAVKYSRAGGQIRVALEIRPEAAIVTVTDEGIGIEAAEVRHLFDPFFRGSNALRAQIRGAGIGLSLVKNIVDAHQATITVKSKIDVGSTFTLALPRVLVRDDSEKRLVSQE